MSHIKEWNSKNFYQFNAIDLFPPFNFPQLALLIGTDTSKHYDNLDDYTLTALRLANEVIDIDHLRKNNELNYIKSFFTSKLGEHRGSSAFYMLEQYRQKGHKLPLIDVYQTINENLSRTEKHQLIHYLFELSDADEEITYKELGVIYNICKKIRISKKEMNQITAIYINGYVPFPPRNLNMDDRKYGTNHIFYANDRKKKESKKRQRKSRAKAKAYLKYFTTSRLTLSLQVLGLTKNASIPQIKAAYRKLVKENHPDRFRNLGEVHMEKANDRLIQINRAYEYIQKVKRFS